MRFHHHHPEALSRQPSVEPLRQAIRLKPDVLNASFLLSDETGNVFGLTRAFALPDDHPALVYDRARAMPVRGWN